MFEESDCPSIGRAEFGLLNCECSVFPVIDGIPIIQRDPVRMLEHTQGRPETEGITVGALVELIRGGHATKALVECLALPYFPRSLRAILGWRMSCSKIVERISRAAAMKKFFRRILAKRDEIDACDVFRFYYFPGSPLGPELGHYYIRKFSQPRHLAALALVSTVPSASKPILDIACGTGHLEHYFCRREDWVPVIGLDMNFFQLWIARHWIAPGGSYICANANDSLPFVEASFSAVVCTDAYHYIQNHQHLLAEIERCAPNRPVILTRVGNASVMPNEGVERSLEAYMINFGRPVRVFDETSLLNCYLKRIDPFALADKPLAAHEESKWLSFAWNVPAGPESSLNAEELPPHAVGDIGPNPIYVITRMPAGDLQFQFHFPDTWFAFENHAMLTYHPGHVTISAEQSAQLPTVQYRGEMRSLVDSFVLIGLPKRFGSQEL